MPNPVKIPGVIADIKVHDEEVYSVSIVSPKNIPRFRAGQFLHLTLDDYDPEGGFWPESRVFSIASAPSNRRIDIVYSAKGRYTTRMSREIALGKSVWLKLPYGDFSIETRSAPGQDIVLVAGGTGISPFMAYLQDAIAHGSANGRRLYLLYGIRKPEHLLCSDMLKACCLTLKEFHLDLFLENGVHPTIHPDVRCFNGRISLERIIECGKALSDPAFFLSGPPTMIQSFKHGLKVVGVSDEHIKIDEWE
jgi:ferredoxin-NADP reductase